MSPLRCLLRLLPAVVAVLCASRGPCEAVEVDLSAHDPASGVEVQAGGDRITARWPMEGGETGEVVLDLGAGRPLVEALRVSAPGAAPATVLAGVSPAFWITAGIREAPGGRPPGMSVWSVFFDNPARRPHSTHESRLDVARARVESVGRRASITLSGTTIGPFRGDVAFTLYSGTRLLRIEATVSTDEDRRAIIYDAGLVGPREAFRRAAWTDTEGSPRDEVVGPESASRRLAVRHRMLAVEGEGGAVAILPPPHQFQFPRDLSDNLGFTWLGSPHGAAAGASFGAGVCQAPEGGGPFVPWFNAPPGTRQRLGFFCVLSREGARACLGEALRFTRGDRFPRLPGHLTLTSHWHMAIAVASLARDASKPPPVPDFVRMFKDMGADMVHLGEFHGDGHQFDRGPVRLRELEAMFQECRRLSDGELLLIPGEEVNKHLGLPAPGRHAGHWMSLFPKPVLWILERAEGEPYVEERPGLGRVYRVGSREDVLRILEDEGGLAWAAHPRIKASSWTPDIFRKEDFYLSATWLGGAWKAMPADLSHDRLGLRGLDLLDDMSNWSVSPPPGAPPAGRRKYLPGEVDVFKINRTHELYGHMNINYLRMERLPRFDEGWAPVLEALRTGRFFVTTGEILIRDLTAGGARSGETIEEPADGPLEVRADIAWTFPLEHAGLISGDGERVYQERIDLRDTGAFGERLLTLPFDARGRRWVRLEVWDAAANGAFTQPVWIEPRKP
ncbi:MAG TPA: hypothetical protein VMT52_19685 [Planctomycetota bacterium]|nr:hypothetical protein [Planctomycetota bacterium]